MQTHLSLILALLLALNNLKAQSRPSDFGFTLLGQKTFGNDTTLANVWGYTAPDGAEYALVGQSYGLSIIGLTGQNFMRELAHIQGFPSIWREVRTYQNLAYVVCEQGNDGLIIIDLQHLPDSAPYRHVYPPIPLRTNDSLRRVHTIHIDTTTGRLFALGSNAGGACWYDLNQNPWQPQLLGHTDLNIYVHDAHAQGPQLYTADMIEGTVSVHDLSNPQQAQTLARFETPKRLSHNIWPTDSAGIILVTDERPGSWLTAYNVANLNDVREICRWREGEQGGDTASISHNVHTLNDFAFVAHYTSGLVVLDAKRPHNLAEVARYDSYRGPQRTGFFGAWGVYPYLASGRILVSDINTGLHVLQANNLQRAAWLEGQVLDAQTNLPIAGVQLNLSPTRFGAKSNNNGNFGLGLATSGRFVLYFSREGYFGDSLEVSLSQDSLTLVSKTLQPWPLALNPNNTNPESFKVYPNPSSNGRLQILSNQALNNRPYQLSDWTGRICHQAQIQNPNTPIELDLSQLPQGWYFLSIEGLGTQLIQKTGP